MHPPSAKYTDRELTPVLMPAARPLDEDRALRRIGAVLWLVVVVCFVFAALVWLTLLRRLPSERGSPRSLSQSVQQVVVTGTTVGLPTRPSLPVLGQPWSRQGLIRRNSVDVRRGID